MSYELEILRAMVRLARRRSPASREQLVLRVGGTGSHLRAALRALSQADLVVRTASGVRLTMSGLAVGLASSRRVGGGGVSHADRKAPKSLISGGSAALAMGERDREAAWFRRTVAC